MKPALYLRSTRAISKGAEHVDPRFAAVQVQAPCESSWLALALAGAAASSGGAESGLRTTELRSGLHTFLAGHLVLLTLAEVGPPGSFSRATLLLHDDAERLVASLTGVARRGQPLRIEYEVPANPPRVQFRASLSIVAVDGGGSAAVAGLEDFDPLNSTITGRVFCAPGSGRTDPETICPDWEADSETSAE